jgi:hypothetical protein
MTTSAVFVARRIRVTLKKRLAPRNARPSIEQRAKNAGARLTHSLSESGFVISSEDSDIAALSSEQNAAITKRSATQNSELRLSRCSN